MRSRLPEWLFRGVGALLLLLTLTPVYRVLARQETGGFGERTVGLGDTNLEAAWWGIVASLGAGVALAILFPSAGLRRTLGRAGKALSRPPAMVFALGVGGVSAALSLLAGFLLFRRLPTLVDEMASLLHGRVLAAGGFALPLPDPAAAWMIPNSLLTPQGWASQYPPFHLLLLAGGELMGAPWLVGPLLVGLTATLSILVAGHLFPGDPRVVRLGGILVGLSPFLLFLGSGYLSHVPAAAFAALTLWATLRARDGGWGWSVLTGAGCGALVATRPWLGVFLGVALPVALWAGALRGRGPRDALGWLGARFAGATLGGGPFALGMALYNQHLFGHPLRLGYSLAYGPSHDLGFHPDPWGNVYGPLEALGYTASSFLTLGIYLLETPIPALALVGAYLLATPRPPRGTGVLLAWALLPALANAYYWHHGFHLGPRMLYEAAPAWALLTGLAALRLAGGGEPHPGSPPGATPSALRRIHPRDVLLWGLMVSLLGALALIPLRIGSYRWTEETLARILPPELPSGDPALVFVHGSWSERLGARLQADGMRLDSIETALQRNDLCRVHRYVEARLGPGSRSEARAAAGEGSPELPPLDFQLLPGTPSELAFMEVTPGHRVRVAPGEEWGPECLRELRADRLGVISLAPLLWQGDLPGMGGRGAMFVRDLGPGDNQRVRRAFPGREAYFLLAPGEGESPLLLPYGEGEEILWGEG